MLRSAQPPQPAAEPYAHPPAWRSLFEYHGKIDRCVISSGVDGACIGHIRFTSAAAAKTALMFDNYNFLGQTITVQLSDEEMPPVVEAPTAPPLPRNESFPTTARVSTSAGVLISVACLSRGVFVQCRHPLLPEPSPWLLGVQRRLAYGHGRHRRR